MDFAVRPKDCSLCAIFYKPDSLSMSLPALKAVPKVPCRDIKTRNPVNSKFTGFCINMHNVFVEIRGIEPLTS